MDERVQKQYWDESWEAEIQLPETFDPSIAGVRGLFRRLIHGGWPVASTTVA